MVIKAVWYWCMARSTDQSTEYNVKEAQTNCHILYSKGADIDFLNCYNKVVAVYAVEERKVLLALSFQTIIERTE